MRVRFTVRGMMVAVAVVALTGAGVRWTSEMRRRAHHYSVNAEIHDIMRRVAEIKAESSRTDYGLAAAARGVESLGIDVGALDLINARRADERREDLESAAWHAKRRDLYKEAAARPWNDVPEAKEPERAARRADRRDAAPAKPAAKRRRYD